ncbi:hypothetical protein CAPN010_10220 [Capnocytophaga cynodegmi]|uniref:hypothetical protein n=1 Tax=Capnocytophaga cynodegmi TaxID=28189 RepID=UPI001EE2A64E|nr:hypothetical protein [Capnocytophaga cynodegmi]GJQ06864.1 hypothetical protein CAPN010_10220 [Capnocytophaga cynodegmi]
MALDNVISVEFSSEELKKINDALTAIEQVMKDKSVNLTPDERQQYGRIADRNKLLVDKCKAYMELNPQTLPPTLDKAEFDKDYQARTQIDPIMKRIAVLQTIFSDMKTLLDFDNFNASVSYYRYVKYLSIQNAPGMTAIYSDLKTHYQSRQATNVAPKNAPEAPTDTP